MADVRLRVNVPAPRVRLRVLPSLLPTQIELRNNGTAVQWRYIDGNSDWADLILIDDIDVEVTIGTVTTLPAGSPATVVNVGTQQNPVLNFGIPAGANGTNGTIQTVNGDAGPDVSLVASEIPFTPAGTIASTNVQAALEEIASEAGAAGSNSVQNLGLLPSVAASALTIALKQSDGATNPSVAAPVTMGMRDATAANGKFNTRSVAAAQSLVVNSGATLGSSDGKPHTLRVLEIDNAGTLEMAIIGGYDPGESGIISTTAISAAADLSGVAYSTTARANVAFRKIAELVSTQVTAGTWAVVPTLVALAPFGQTTTPIKAEFTGLIAGPTYLCDGHTTSNKQMNARQRYQAKQDITSLQCVFPNWYVTSAGVETNNGGNMVLEAAVEYPVGVTTRLLFSASNSITIAAGNNGTSDALAINIPEGAEFWIRTFQNNPTDIVFQGTLAVEPFYVGYSEVAASGLTSKVLTGTITPGSGGNGFGPIAIIGTTNKKSVAIFGDSRQIGNSDLPDMGLNIGEVQRSLGTVLPVMNLSRSGDQTNNFVASHAKRIALAPYVTGAAVVYGINDIANARTAAQVKADLESIIGYMSSIPVYVGTLAPRSTSTDGWITLANQTVDANKAVRDTLNGFIRAGLTGAAGYFEIADAVESSRGSGKWKPGVYANQYTDDGLHETQMGNQLIVDLGAIDPKVFDNPRPGLPFASLRHAIQGARNDLIVSPYVLRRAIRGIRDGQMFTPSIVGATSAGAGTYTDRYGVYRQRGNVVDMHLMCDWSAHTGTGNLDIECPGLPPGALYGIAAGLQPLNLAWNRLTFAAVPTAFIRGGQSKISLYAIASTGSGTRLAIDADAQVWISGSYFTDQLADEFG